jgi:acyl carrier protein
MQIVDMDILLSELKTRIIESLRLEDMKPDQIDNDAPLFGTGLGLDSIDALELVVMLEQKYGIVIKHIEEGRPAFQSVRTLAAFVQARRTC